MESTDINEGETELQLAANPGEREMAVSSADIRHDLVDTSAGDELNVAKTTLSKLLKNSDDVVRLLLSGDQLEPQLLSDIAEQLLKALEHICEHLTKLQPKILHLTGQVMCLESTESISLMYKFHDKYFLSEE